jgi:WD40 repeat protein
LWCFSATSQTIVVLNPSSGVVRWQGQGFQEKRLLPEVGTAPPDLSAISSDGALLAKGSRNGAVEVWDLEKPSLLHRFTTGTNRVKVVGFVGPSRIVTAQGRSMSEWDLGARRPTRSWNRPASAVVWALSANGRWLLALDEEGNCWLKDMTTGQERTNRLKVNSLHEAVFSPDGRFLAVSDEFRAVVYETDSLRRIAEFGGFLLGGGSVAFSPDGKRLAGGSATKEAVKLWDLESKQELLSLEGQGVDVLFKGLAFSADGNVLGWMSRNGVLHLWRAPSFAEIEAAEKVQPRTIGPAVR